MLKKLLLLSLIFIFLFAFAGCSSTTNTEQQSKSAQTQQVSNVQTQQTNTQEVNQATQQQSNENTNRSVSNKLIVSFIDVGQGDSIFIQTPSGKTMLIDAGVPEMGSKVVDYIKSRGVNKIDILIGTHPHADHIGGIPAVIENFEIGKFYMPKVTTTTKTFENVLRAAKAKGLSISVAKAGVTLDLGEEIKAKMLAPNSTHYDDLNNYSAVIKVTYGNTAFMFTGDAEKESEQEMLSKGYDLKADVLKVGHHGSSSASTWAFLKAVNPKYAVISVGKNNDYGHPHKETMEKLKSLGVIVYRTDQCGTVVATSDGKTISFNVKPGDYTAGSSGNKSTSSISSAKTFVSDSNQNLPYGYYGEPGKVYVDSNGRGLIKGNINSKGEKIYHIPGDPWYDRTKAEAWFKTEAEAQAAGFRPPKR
ncbi:putative hydrolase (metallo-beta-lactamase superfamily) [Thermoanaerobacter siderophilus SR4]|uniref:Putative hydrolase (Metallo-beta-lactamase superfamily) n=1 Tax=Thermoanaerobacter siderophilus SR4 TaxID=880478 RepID=I8R3D6_9THEO|nr:putative hydrolase (metallo-beta-lactamase superfamily) [Thermoanaerobacter siderophilus SR4]